MGLVEAVRTCLKKYATFSGRSRRSEFWWFYLAYALVTAIFSVPAAIVFVVGTAGTSSTDLSSAPAGGGATLVVGIVLYGLALLVSLALLLPFLAVAVRRLHDTGRSGWWYLLGVVPIVNFVGIIVLIVFWVQDGTPGPNRFGPSPEGVGPAGTHDQQGAHARGDQGYGHPAQA